MIIVGGLGDQVSSLVWGTISSGPLSIPEMFMQNEFYVDFFRVFLYPLQSNQPLLWLTMSLGLTFFGVGFYNFYTIFVIFLNFISSYVLFKKYRFGLLFSLTFTFSSYFWIHLGLHPALINVWPLPLLLNELIFVKTTNFSIKRLSRIVLIVLGSTLISNYIGFAAFIMLVFYALSDIRNIKVYTIILGVAGILSVLVLWPYFYSNYYLGGPKTRTAGYIDRPYEDFFYFSSRPWYFFIASPKNPILGSLSEGAIEKIKSTNYFLADDYQASEHAASYFGLSFIGLVVFATVNLIVVKPGKAILFDYLRYLCMAVGVTLLMLPPYITIFGYTIYTPGQLIYLLFPMFRVTVRLSVLVHLLMLIFVGEVLFRRSPISLSQKQRLLVLALLALSMFEMFVPPKFEIRNIPGDMYVSLITKVSDDSKIVALSGSLLNDAMYWLSLHKKMIYTEDYIKSDDADYILVPADKINTEEYAKYKQNREIYLDHNGAILLK